MILALIRPYLIAGAVGMAALAVGYLWGRSAERAAGRIEQLKATIEAVEKRENIDEDVASADRYQLCISLGGLRDQCNELRRMEEAAKPE